MLPRLSHMNLKAMSFRKIIAAVSAIASIAFVGLAVLHPSGIPLMPFSFTQPSPHNSISGLPGGDGPVLVVKIDDTRQAHPQIGLENADIVYIEQVEGGLTRLAAVFSSSIPKRIGPVRSARISDIELLEQYGRVGFAYSGAQKLMRPVIASANLEDLGAQTHSSTIYTTDPARIPPYAMVLRADSLMQFVKDRGINLAESKNMGWKFGDAPQGGTQIRSAHISWPANSYDAHWSSSENRWLLDHSYTPNISDSGIQLGPKTFIIQLVSITNSIYKDKVGGITPFSATVGEGRGYILRDGRVFEARWSRPDAVSGTSWKLTNGEEISFPRGQIWVALTDKEPVFTGITSDAGMKSSK